MDPYPRCVRPQWHGDYPDLSVGEQASQELAAKPLL